MSVLDQYFAGADEVLVGIVSLPHALNGKVEDRGIEADGHGGPRAGRGTGTGSRRCESEMAACRHVYARFSRSASMLCTGAHIGRPVMVPFRSASRRSAASECSARTS